MHTKNTVRGGLFLATASVAFATCAACCQSAGAAETSTDGTVRVMSFNIRYGSAKDGKDHWSQRKDLVAHAINSFEPDLLGTQETMRFQSTFLQKQLPNHTAFGRTRDASGDAGEQCTIFYRTDRFTKIGAGHFWLSESPDTPGVKSWDAALPRMVTWLCLRDAQRPEQPICIFNTHFDHRGKQARQESAKLLAKKSAEIARSHGNAHVIVTGDFNSGEDDAPYRNLLEEQPNGWNDTYRTAHPERNAHEGTFNGFRGTDDGARIDWIFADARWLVQSAEIVRWNQDGRYPSDHCPVTAVLKPQP